MAFIVGLFKRKLTNTQEVSQDFTVKKFRVWLTEAEGSLLNNARYLTFMEVARMDLMTRTGHFLYSLKKKWLPLVGSQYICYKKPLKRFQKFEVKTKLIYWDAKWFYAEHRFEREGKLMAYGYVKIAWLKRGGTISPKELLGETGFDSAPPPKPDFISKWEESEQQMKTHTLKKN